MKWINAATSPPPHAREMWACLTKDGKYMGIYHAHTDGVNWHTYEGTLYARYGWKCTYYKPFEYPDPPKEAI